MKVIDKLKNRIIRLLKPVKLTVLCFFIASLCCAASSSKQIESRSRPVSVHKDVSIQKKQFIRKSEVKSPVEEVERETSAMLAIYKKKYEYFKANVEEFIKEVRSRLEPRIDFAYISRGVMSSYGKMVDEETRKQFTINFRDSLFRFYSKAVLAVDHPNVIIQKMDFNQQELEAYKKGTIRQLPIGMEVRAGSKQVKVVYKMVFNEAEQKWVLRNILVDSLNVGVMFRKVFQDAMESSDDRVVITKKLSAKQKRVAQIKHVVKNWRYIVNKNRPDEKAKEVVK